jgi:hypothetical protein
MFYKYVKKKKGNNNHHTHTDTHFCSFSFYFILASFFFGYSAFSLDIWCHKTIKLFVELSLFLIEHLLANIRTASLLLHHSSVLSWSSIVMRGRQSALSLPHFRNVHRFTNRKLIRFWHLLERLRLSRFLRALTNSAFGRLKFYWIFGTVT